MVDFNSVDPTKHSSTKEMQVFSGAARLRADLTTTARTQGAIPYSNVAAQRLHAAPTQQDFVPVKDLSGFTERLFQAMANEALADKTSGGNTVLRDAINDALTGYHD